MGADAPPRSEDVSGRELGRSSVGGPVYLVDLFDRLRWVLVWRHLTSYPDWMTDVDRALFRRTFFEDLVRWHVPQPMAG